MVNGVPVQVAPVSRATMGSTGMVSTDTRRYKLGTVPTLVDGVAGGRRWLSRHQTLNLLDTIIFIILFLLSIYSTSGEISPDDVENTTRYCFYTIGRSMGLRRLTTLLATSGMHKLCQKGSHRKGAPRI